LIVEMQIIIIDKRTAHLSEENVHVLKPWKTLKCKNRTSKRIWKNI